VISVRDGVLVKDTELDEPMDDAAYIEKERNGKSLLLVGILGNHDMYETP
jgi:hypothetical protein